MLELGQGAADITPKVGAIMDGFAARPGPARRILDRLSVRALCFRNSGRRFSLLAFDLIGLRGPLREAVEKALIHEVGLDAGSFMTASTHTHAGPVGGVLQDLPVDEAYCEAVARAVVTAVRAAEADYSPVDLDVQGGGVAFPVNRRLRRGGPTRLDANYEGCVDRTVRLLRAFRKDGSAKAVIAHASCHPLALPGSNTAISADYPGVMYAGVERDFPGVLPMFLLGSAGDVNPIVLPGEKPEAARERCGGELAAVTVGLLKEPRAVAVADSDEAFGWDQAMIDVPLTCPLSPEQLDGLAQENRRQADAADTPLQRYIHSRQANWYAGLSRKTRPELLRSSVTVKLQVFMPRRDVLFVALPFEVFTATSQELLTSLEQLGLDRQRVFITSCANEIHGYLPPASALREGGYECEDAPIWYGLPGWYAEGAEAHVRENVVRLARGLLEGHGARGGGT